MSGLLGFRGGAELPPGSPVATLVTFRMAPRADGQMEYSSATLLPRVAVHSTGAGAAAKRRLADARELAWLSGIFSATPVVSASPTALGASAENLVGLANSYVSQIRQSDANADAVQIINTAYAAQSFMNMADFYYVHQEADFQPADQPTSIINGVTITTLTRPATFPTIIQPSPQTTMSTTSVTSVVSVNLGGNVGYNQTQGINASLSLGVTISNSTTTTYPPILIRNTTDITTGIANFGYALHDASQGVGSDLTFNNHWIWQVPFSAYAAGQASIAFATTSTLYEENPLLTANLTSVVPLPFGDTFTLQVPAVKSASPSTVGEGQTFIIKGSGFYPSLVTSVVIGGTPLLPTQYSVKNDTEIDVVAPNQFGILPQRVVVQTTQGVSNDNVTITIH